MLHSSSLGQRPSPWNLLECQAATLTVPIFAIFTENELSVKTHLIDDIVFIDFGCGKICTIGIDTFAFFSTCKFSIEMIAISLRLSACDKFTVFFNIDSYFVIAKICFKNGFVRLACAFVSSSQFDRPVDRLISSAQVTNIQTSNQMQICLR